MSGARLEGCPPLDERGCVEVLIEVPSGSFVKRDHRGRVRLISPLPCPFNYGSLPGTLACDGDPVDALILGPRRARGERARLPVRGVVRFTDAGQPDAKWLLGEHLTRVDVDAVERFFRLYALAKRLLNAANRRPWPTRFEGIELSETFR